MNFMNLFETRDILKQIQGSISSVAFGNIRLEKCLNRFEIYFSAILHARKNYSQFEFTFALPV